MGLYNSISRSFLTACLGFSSDEEMPPASESGQMDSRLMGFSDDENGTNFFPLLLLILVTDPEEILDKMEEEDADKLDFYGMFSFVPLLALCN